MISKTAQYAVRACLWLGAHPAQVCPVQQIARETGVPAGYLAKVLKLLARAGLVRSQPGPGGGFLLSRAPEHICVLEVVQASDPISRIRNGSPAGNGRAAGLNPLQARLDRVLALVQDALRDCTLAALLAESAQLLSQEGSKS